MAEIFSTARWSVLSVNVNEESKPLPPVRLPVKAPPKRTKGEIIPLSRAIEGAKEADPASFILKQAFLGHASKTEEESPSIENKTEKVNSDLLPVVKTNQAKGDVKDSLGDDRATTADVAPGVLVESLNDYTVTGSSTLSPIQPTHVVVKDAMSNDVELKTKTTAVKEDIHQQSLNEENASLSVEDRIEPAELGVTEDDVTSGGTKVLSLEEAVSNGSTAYCTEENVKDSKTLLILISQQSFDRQVVKNQQNAMTILDSKGVKYELLDGADPANKEERNSLFNLSGLRAIYPQFFLVQSGEKSFYGNMDTFNEANEIGTLAADLGGKAESTLAGTLSTMNDNQIIADSLPLPAKKSSEVSSREIDADNLTTAVDTAGTETDGKITANPAEELSKNASVLVLISRQSFGREVFQNQQNAMTILDSKGIKYTLLDGSDPVNKDERDVLFALSGLRAKYPQFFLLRGGEKVFYGDMKTLNNANEIGTLSRDLSGEADAPVPREKQESPVGNTQEETLAMVQAKSNEAQAPEEQQKEEASIVDTSLSSRVESRAGGNFAESLAVEETMDSGATAAASANGRELENGVSAQKTRSPDFLATCTGSIKKALETDITIYGVESDVAKDVIAYLLQASVHLSHPLKITLGGRDAARLADIKDECEAKMERLLAASPEANGKCSFDAYRAAEMLEIFRMAHRTKVVLNCVGPFSQSGGNVVDACAEYGTDYVDLSSDLTWASKMRKECGRVVAASGARIISMCGCNPIPSDLAVLAAVEALRKEAPNNPVNIEKTTKWHAVLGAPKAASFVAAMLMYLGLLLCMIVVKLPILGPLVSHYLKSEYGPSDQMRPAGHCEVYAQVCGPIQKNGKVDKGNALVKFKGDFGNRVTAQCASEAALSLLLDREDLPTPSSGGFGTATELLGETLLKRLQASRVRPIHFFTNVRKNTDQTESHMFP